MRIGALSLPLVIASTLSGCVAGNPSQPTSEQLARDRPPPPGQSSAARWLAGERAPLGSAASSSATTDHSGGTAGAADGTAEPREGYWHYDGVRYHWVAYPKGNSAP